MIAQEYMTLDQFMNTIELDFKKYSKAGLIDTDTLLSTIAYCNSQTGVHLSPIKTLAVDIINCKVDIPEFLHKVKSIDIITNYGTESSIPLYENWTKVVTEKPTKDEFTYTPLGWTSDNGCHYWVVPYKNTAQEYIIFTDKQCLSSTIDKPSKDEFKIDRENEKIEFGIKSGKAVITYYTDLTAQNLIPKNPILYPWWAWSIKVAILQSILFNSEDDVSQKLAYAERERNLAFLDVDSYIKRPSYKTRKQKHQQQEQDFYKKWNKGIK